MSEEKIANIDSRVRNLEAYFKVALLVSAIFGIGGGFGAFAINSAYKEINNLESHLNTLKSDISTMKFDAEKIAAELNLTLIKISDEKNKSLEELNKSKSEHIRNMDEKASSIKFNLIELATSEINRKLLPVSDRVRNIEEILRQNEIIAIATIRNSKLEEEKSSPGVSYDAQLGIVTFNNKNNNKYVTIVSDYTATNPDIPYRSDTNFLLSYVNSTSFRVWNTPMDTSNRNKKPDSFTAIVIKIK